MQRFTIFTAIASLVLALAACTPPDQEGPGENAKSASPLTLPGTTWVAKTIAGQSIPGNIKVTMNFSDEGRITGTSGCNRYFGSYKIDDDKLTIGPLAGTKMMCGAGAMEVENNFLSVLHNTETFSASDAGNLIIKANNGDTIKAKK